MEQQNSTSKVPQTISPRNWSQLPPTQYISSFTLQQKGNIGSSFAGGTDRFATVKPGSYFATNTAEPSTFRLNNPFHKPHVPQKDEIPQHRPLWMSEIRKEVPAGAQYDLDSTFGSKKTLFKTRTHAFKHTYEKYQRTCDIQKDIKVFDSNADQDQRGVASYDLEVGLKATKKRNPCFSQSKAKQFELWNKEIKKAEVTPAPDSYNQETCKQAKLARFDNIHLGTDKKTTAKDVPLTPGPGHYMRVDEQYARTFHHATKHGTQQVFQTINNTGVRKSQHSGNLGTSFEFFGGATGSDFFDDQKKKKLVQPPMLAGKAKIPNDLQCVLSFNTHESRQQHKTIDYAARTQTSSFVNASIKDFTGKLSPIDYEGATKGRHSLFLKTGGAQRGSGPVINTQRSPPQRPHIFNNAQSAENFDNSKKKSKVAYINVESNEKIAGKNLFAQTAKNSQLSKPLKAGTIGSMSDVSTTVRAASLQNNYGKIKLGSAASRASQSKNFAELGAGLIRDTPSSKRSIQFSEFSKRRSSVGQSADRTRMRNANRPSSRNLLNFGNFTHCSFI